MTCQFLHFFFIVHPETKNYQVNVTNAVVLEELSLELIDKFQLIVSLPNSDTNGSVYREMGDLPNAIKDYQAATVADSKLTIAFNNLGSVYRKSGEYDKAIKAHSDAISLDSKFYLAYNNRGFAKFSKGDFQGAINDFNITIELKSDYAFAYNNLASAYIKLEKYEEAIQACGKAIELDAKYGYAFLNRGIAFEMLRNWKEFAVTGGAGTGKTVLAFNRALTLASQGARTLFLCHSSACAAYLRDLVDPRFAENLEIYSSSEFISDVMQSPESRKLFFESGNLDVVSADFLGIALKNQLFYDALIVILSIFI